MNDSKRRIYGCREAQLNELLELSGSLCVCVDVMRLMSLRAVLERTYEKDILAY